MIGIYINFLVRDRAKRTKIWEHTHCQWPQIIFFWKFENIKIIQKFKNNSKISKKWYFQKSQNFLKSLKKNPKFSEKLKKVPFPLITDWCQTWLEFAYNYTIQYVDKGTAFCKNA